MNEFGRRAKNPLSSTGPNATKSQNVLADPSMTADMLSRSCAIGRDHDAFDEVRATRSYRVVYLVVLLFIAFGLWAWCFDIDEVSSGSGKVIPTSREQVIQSLEGGIVTELYVREGDIVEMDQVLAKLDSTKTESNVEEMSARYRAPLVSSS